MEWAPVIPHGKNQDRLRLFLRITYRLPIISVYLFLFVIFDIVMAEMNDMEAILGPNSFWNSVLLVFWLVWISATAKVIDGLFLEETEDSRLVTSRIISTRMDTIEWGLLQLTFLWALLGFIYPEGFGGVKISFDHPETLIIPVTPAVILVTIIVIRDTCKSLNQFREKLAQKKILSTADSELSEEE